MLSIKMERFKRLQQQEFEKELQNQKEEFIKELQGQKEELLNRHYDELKARKEENEVLRNELSELKTSIEKKDEKRITANRQMLILHYLGFLDSINFVIKERKYDVFYNIIDKNRQAVKSFFNYREQEDKEEYTKIFNEEDLYFVSNLFKEAGLQEYTKKVDADILKFKF